MERLAAVVLAVLARRVRGAKAATEVLALLRALLGRLLREQGAVVVLPVGAADQGPRA
jgi:hypothetical protein